VKLQVRRKVVADDVQRARQFGLHGRQRLDANPRQKSHQQKVEEVVQFAAVADDKVVQGVQKYGERLND